MAGVQQSMSLAQAAQWLQGLGNRLDGMSWRKPLTEVAFYLANQARKSFDQAQAPDGTPWPPLKNPSARRGGPAAKPLRDTGRLMGSLIGQGPGHIEDVGDARLVWGTSVEYASYHQEGTGRIPARPFMGLTPEMEGTIAAILLDHAERFLKGQP